MNQQKKIRYAVVGAGWISQAAFMPGVKHTGNSELTALVTGDPKKAKELAKKYEIPKTYTYEQYGELLKSGEIDAVYLALPNDLHTEYTFCSKSPWPRPKPNARPSSTPPKKAEQSS
jgi:predicted dehydrogenase